MDVICRYKQRAGFIASFYASPMALRIRQLREAKGWTQDDLAERAGLSRSQLAQIESEARPANTLRLNSIANALGVKPYSLFCISDAHDRIIDAVDKLSEGDRAALLRMAEALALQRDIAQ